MSKSDVIVYHDVSEIRRVELLSKDYLLVLYFLISSLLTHKCLVLTSTPFEPGTPLTTSQPQKSYIEARDTLRRFRDQGTR